MYKHTRTWVNTHTKTVTVLTNTKPPYTELEKEKVICEEYIFKREEGALQ